MAINKHVFVCTNGLLLPGWLQAFAKAVAVTPDQIPTLHQGDFLWLRLQSGTQAQQQIRPLRLQGVALIILSDTPNDSEAMSVFALSARGYANAHAGSETLKQIARVVDQGGLWLGESLMQRLMLGMQHLPRSEPAVAKTPPPRLTVREMEVAKAIAAGASNKEVARQLEITERTVKAHVSGLFNKLGVQDRLQLALKMRDLF
jgi:DNA-binding NarL/FixJ family response regulator